MDDKKNFSEEMLEKYISSEIELIDNERKDKSNWKKNKEFNSQVSIRMEDDK